MDELIPFLLRHGHALLFAWVLADQLGLPLPVFPVLMGTGALIGTGQFSLGTTIPLAGVAALLSGQIWYEIGRRRGDLILHSLCQISLQPDACVRRTEDIFSRYGQSVLLWARFVPGMTAIATPMAGTIRMPRLRFFLFNVTGAFLWTSTFILIGYLFTDQIEYAIQLLQHLGHILLVLGIPLAIYVGIKYIRRQRYLKSQHNGATLDTEDDRQPVETEQSG